MLLAQGNTKHISTIAHEGKVLIVASVVADGTTKLFYTVKQDGFENSALQNPNGTGWDTFKELALPNDSVGDASVTSKEKEDLTYQKGAKYLLRSIYKSANLTADAPIQLVSHDGHVFIFRQSTQRTLLVDRFVLDGMTNTLVPKLEVRFKRSRQRHKPLKAMKISSGGQLGSVDSLDFRDMQNEPFYEPTTELCPEILNDLENGAFGVVVTPTNEQGTYRWHIFAYNRTSKKVDLLTLRAGSEQVFDMQDYWFRTIDPATDKVHYDSIPGIIRRELRLEDSAGKPLTISNGLAVAAYDVQREQQTQNGPQLMRDSSKILLAVPTDQGIAALSFAIAADGRLAQIARQPLDTTLRSQEREILLPLNLPDNIRAVGDLSQAPAGSIARMSRSTEEDSADRVRVQVSDQDKAALKRLKNSNVIKLNNTAAYDGLYRVGAVDNGAFTIDATLKFGAVGDWEKVEAEDTGLTFDGMLTGYEKSSDGKLKVHAFNHGLAAGDLVQIVGSSAYDGEYPILKHDDSSFTIQRLWVNGEAVNIKIESRKRHGLVFDGKQDWIEVPLPDGLKLSYGFVLEAWVKLTNAGDQTLIASGPASTNLTGVAHGGWQAALSLYKGKFTFALHPFGPHVQAIRLQSSSAATLNQWVHVACVFDGRALQLLEDGAIKQSLAVEELHKRALKAHEELVLALRAEVDKQEAALRPSTMPPHPVNYDTGKLVLRADRHVLSAEAGDTLVLATSGDQLEQSWRVEADGDDFIIRNLATNRVLNESGQQSTWKQEDSQRWKLEAIPDGYYLLRSKSRATVLEARAGRMYLVEARPVGTRDSEYQQWRFAASGESKVKRAKDALDAVKNQPPQPDAPIVISTEALTLAGRATTTSALGRLGALEERLNGQLADARVWVVARTPTEVYNTMHLQLTGREAGLAGYWRLGGVAPEADGTLRVFDFSANADHGTARGAPYAGGVTLKRTLGDNKTLAVKFSNADLLAVREGAAYIESFEFRTAPYVDPENADGKDGKLFKPSLWGRLSRNSEAKPGFKPMQENFQFDVLDEGWRRASCRFIIPQGVRLLRCFELADLRGTWDTLEIRRHTLKLVSDTVTHSNASESARLNTSTGLLAAGLEQMLREREVQRLIKEEADLKKAYDAEVANPFNYWCKLVAKHSGKCIYIAEASKNDGAPAVQWTWSTTTANGDPGLWKFEPLTDGSYRIVNKNSNKSLVVIGASKEWAAPLGQWTDDKANPIGDHGKWKVELVGDGYFKIIAKHSGLSSDVYAKSRDDNMGIVQWVYEGNPNQLWKCERVGDAITTKIQDAQTLWEAKKKELTAAQARLTDASTELGKLQTDQQALIVQKPPLEARLKELYSSLFALSNLEQTRQERDAQQVLVTRLTAEESTLKKKYDAEVADPFNYWCGMRAKHSGQYLQCYGSGGTGTAVQGKWDRTVSPAMPEFFRWKFEPLGDGYFRLTDKAFKRSLFVEGVSLLEGARLQTAPGSDPQPYYGRWKFEDAGDGYYKIMVHHSKKYVAVPGGNTAEQAQTVQWSWNGQDSQRWKLEPTSDTINTKIQEAQKPWEAKKSELLLAQAELDRLNKLLNEGEANRTKWETELADARKKLAKLEDDLAAVTSQLAPLLHPAEVLRQLAAVEREEASLVTRQKELERSLADSQDRAATEKKQKDQQALVDRLTREESDRKRAAETEAANPFNYWCKLFSNRGLYLTIDPGNPAGVFQSEADIGDTQRWKIEPVQGGAYKIVNKKTNTCLEGIGFERVFHRTSSQVVGQQWAMEKWNNDPTRYGLKLYNNPYNLGLLAWGGDSKISLALNAELYQLAALRWKFERVGEPINTKPQDTQRAWLDKQEELRIAQRELDRLNRALAANNAQVKLWQTELADILASLKKLRVRISTLSTAYLALIAKATSTAQTMPELPSQEDPHGLKVQGALLPFAQPATRLHALESCAGRVTLSYQDRDGNLRQSHYDTAYDADGKGEEWLPDTYRAALAFDGKTVAPALPPSLFAELNKQVTIEFWAKGGNDLPKDATFLAVNDEANNLCLRIQLPNKDGEVVWEAGLKSGNTALDTLRRRGEARLYRERWTHWAFVKDGDKGEMRIYINGALWHKNEPKAKDGSDLLRQPLNAVGTGTLGGAPGQSPSWQGQIAELRIWNVALDERELETNSVLTLSGNEPGLIAYYPFNEAQGEIARDQTGHEQTFTITGCTWAPCTAPIGRLPGAPLQLLDQPKTFNGKDNFVQLPAMDLDLSAGLTINARVKFTDLSKPSTLIHLGNGADGGNIELANGGTGNTALVFKIINNTTPAAIGCANAIKAGEWLDIAATIDRDGIARMYLNGVERATGKVPLPIVGLRIRNYIGKHNTASDGLFKGEIANAQLWTSARSADQIKQSWQSGAVSNGLISAEYSRVRVDAQKRKSAMMLRCLALPSADGVRLLDEQRIEELDLKWIGNAQINPTLIGYIEGAPPLPTENLTEEADYKGATSVDLVQSSDVEYSWTREQDASLGADMDLLIGAKSETQAGALVITSVEEIRSGAGGKFDFAYHWKNDSTVSASHKLTINDRLQLRGSQEPEPNFPHLGQRYIPKNIGYALVTSGLADVFVSKLKRSGRMVGYQVLPVEGVPLDVNTITFMINPAYTMAGSLDGLTGSHATSERFFRHVPEMRSQYGSLYPASYFRLTEAYALKQQIDNQDKQHQSYFNQYNAGLVDEASLNRQTSDARYDGGSTNLKGLDNIGGTSNDAIKQLDEQIQAQEKLISDLKKATPAADPAQLKAAENKLEELREQYNKLQREAQEGRKKEGEKRQEEIEASYKDLSKREQASVSFAAWQRKMEDLQIRAGKRNIVNTYVWDGDGGFHTEEQQFASSVEHSIGGSFDFGVSLGGKGRFAIAKVLVELNAYAKMRLTQTMKKTEKGSKGIELHVDLSGVESRGITDHRDYPTMPGEKVDRYRFMSFYLENNVNHWHDFFNQVVDPEWLASNDEEARALRQTQNAAPNKVWRVLHRVTYVERPALMGFGRSPVSRITAPDEIHELRRQVSDLNGRVEALQKEISAKLDQSDQQKEIKEINDKLNQVLTRLSENAKVAGGS